MEDDFPGLSSVENPGYDDDDSQHQPMYGEELVVEMEPFMFRRPAVQNSLSADIGRAKRIGIFKINSDSENPSPGFLSRRNSYQKRLATSPTKFHTMSQFFPGTSYTYVPIGDDGSKRGIYHYVSGEGENSDGIDKRKIGIFHVRGDDSENQLNQKRGLYH